METATNDVEPQDIYGVNSNPAELPILPSGPIIGTAIDDVEPQDIYGIDSNPAEIPIPPSGPTSAKFIGPLPEAKRRSQKDLRAKLASINL